MGEPEVIPGDDLPPFAVPAIPAVAMLAIPDAVPATAAAAAPAPAPAPPAPAPAPPPVNFPTPILPLAALTGDGDVPALPPREPRPSTPDFAPSEPKPPSPSEPVPVTGGEEDDPGDPLAVLPRNLRLMFTVLNFLGTAEEGTGEEVWDEGREVEAGVMVAAGAAVVVVVVRSPEMEEA